MQGRVQNVVLASVKRCVRCTDAPSALPRPFLPASPVPPLSSANKRGSCWYFLHF